MAQTANIKTPDFIVNLDLAGSESGKFYNRAMKETNIIDVMAKIEKMLRSEQGKRVYMVNLLQRSGKGKKAVYNVVLCARGPFTGIPVISWHRRTKENREQPWNSHAWHAYGEDGYGSLEWLSE